MLTIYLVFVKRENAAFGRRLAGKLMAARVRLRAI